MSSEATNVRVVFFGAGRVGKTSLIRQFLFGTYEPAYKETVEDLYTREYTTLDGKVRVDILDTSGSLQFPAMRRLSITSAQAFVVVFAYDDSESFAEAQRILVEIREQRRDCADIPTLFVANKSDLDDGHRRVQREFAETFLLESDNQHCTLVESSAIDHKSVLDVFARLLQLAKTHIARELSPLLRRKLSLRQRREKFEESDKPMERSRSHVARKGSKKQLKKAANMETANECTIS